MQIKQVIVLRSDIKMSVGKAAAQAAHASVSALYESSDKIVKIWKKEGQKKIVLHAKNKEILLELAEKCKKLRISYALISDAGATELKKGTITALGIGPDEESKINKVTGSLPLLK